MHLAEENNATIQTINTEKAQQNQKNGHQEPKNSGNEGLKPNKKEKLLNF